MSLMVCRDVRFIWRCRWRNSCGRSTTTDCHPNNNMEALRVFMDAAGIEAHSVWKPMHKQPCYKDAPAYLKGISEAMFKVGMYLHARYVSVENVRYIEWVY